MFKNTRVLLLFLPFILFILSACKTEDSANPVFPTLVLSTPAAGASTVDVNTLITLQFSENIVVVAGSIIKLNGEVVTASVNSKTVTINAVLKPNTNYTLSVPASTIKNVTGNFAKEITLTFTTIQPVLNDITVYEAEKATLTSDAALAYSLVGFTGTGYVNTNGGNVTFAIQAAQSGYYDVSLRYSTASSKKSNDLYVDGTKIVTLDFSAVNSWTTLAAGRLKLSAGPHTISIVKNWGWMQLDNITVAYYGTTLNPFNISSNLCTPVPSPEAVNLYNFLKQQFGTKVISGTMANYSTNITEATWVHTKTGKWPALTNFDFIDHTNQNQSWIQYTAPFTLGKEWWNNNGIVGLMWHWRDPLTKSGAFYTADTKFDVTKVTDTGSAEYKAIVAGIDLISGYLQQFKDANIPVIWRPLHEASGGWFWWGAKGAEPCKALWRLMYDRMVNVHGLNNMIWVWTTDASSEALNWYPGDNYVDVIGMDIYPGDNQHGSQYFSFNKVKDIFSGKKLITLSECGSVPDPTLMKAQGDMWSWFMPWNGAYTESDTNNGVTWWNKFFSNDFVITRDKMPSLK